MLQWLLAATLVDLLPTPIGWNQFQTIMSKACHRLYIQNVDNKLLHNAFEKTMTHCFGPHRTPITLVSSHPWMNSLVSTRPPSDSQPTPRPRPRRRLDTLQLHLHRASSRVQDAIATPTLPDNVSKLLCDARTSMTKALAATARLVTVKRVRKVAPKSLLNLRPQRPRAWHWLHVCFVHTCCAFARPPYR